MQRRRMRRPYTCYTPIGRPLVFISPNRPYLVFISLPLRAMIFLYNYIIQKEPHHQRPDHLPAKPAHPTGAQPAQPATQPQEAQRLPGRGRQAG